MRQLRLTPDGRLDDSLLLGETHLCHVLDVLNPDGEETRLVGGAVRNALLDQPPGDIDLATTMAPDDVMKCAKAARLRSIPTGIAHGTVTILSGRRSFEVTTLREDVETDGRHAVVRFGRDFALDAERRDFTMNALSLGPDGRIFDTVGGLADLTQGHVRFIGDAATRICEDYLRILRFFRFHATYGLGLLDPQGLAAATENRDGMARLSRERIRAEFFKILVAPGAINVLRAMKAAGILAFVVPGSVHLDRLGRLVAFDAAKSDATLRLAALAIDDLGGIEPLREALRLTNAETKRLGAALAAFNDFKGSADIVHETTLRRMLFKQGRDACADALRLYGATSGEGIHEALAFLRDSPIPEFPFASADLIRRGITGPALGRALTRLRAQWAEAGFPVDKVGLERLLDAASVPQEST